MIASLRGQIRSVKGHALVVEVGGVGYLVRVPTSTLDRSTEPGRPIELYTHMVVRENEISLYGFATTEELDLFEVLIGVNGIGPRMALAILSVFAPETLRHAIAQGDATALTRIPGVGRKTAQRLVLDLKDKLGPPSEPYLGTRLNATDADVVSALTALGYSLSEAQQALAAIPNEARELDERIFAALRALGG